MIIPTHEIPYEITRAKPMTVGELKKRLSNLPSEMPVYLIVDKCSSNAWDDDREQWRGAVPLAAANKEMIVSEDGIEENLLLEYGTA